jgi:hypothetical protein
VVRRDSPGLFNALNLATLQLGRPSALEASDVCREFRDVLDYIAAWRSWYMEIDRAAKFWTEDAGKKAAKHGLTLGTAFGGVFLFDLLCLQALKASFGPSPFQGIANFAEGFPFATFRGKRAAAMRYFSSTGAAIICVQEGRALCDFEDIAMRYQFFYASGDEYTMVLVQHGVEVEAFSIPVLQSLNKALSKGASADEVKAWTTTSSRVAVVRAEIDAVLVTAASVHCSKHKTTAKLLVALKDILEQTAPADHYVIGCDTNVPGDTSCDFQESMVAAGFDIGHPSDQVTVAKQRTMLQTQTLKSGEVDVSCKDYVFWVQN